jgi:TPR repeat protein
MRVMMYLKAHGHAMHLADLRGRRVGAWFRDGGDMSRNPVGRRFLSALLFVIVIAGLTGSAGAQTTTDCTRIGITVNCTTMPLGPSGGAGGAGAFLQGFADGFLRSTEQHRTVIVPAPAPALPPAGAMAPPPAARPSIFGAPPRFSFGEKRGNLYPIRMESTSPPIADHEMTQAELKMCLADPICSGTLSAFQAAAREQWQRTGTPAAPASAPTAAPTDPDSARIHFKEGQRAYGSADYAKAYSEWKPLADAGQPDAQAGLGLLYVLGRGVARDDTQAVLWFRRAAEQGHVWAESNLGFMYETGRGVAKDDREAVRWYQRSAAKQNPASEAALGWMYLEGRGGLSQDDALALQWTRQAAGHGNARGQNNLGVMYRRGRGVGQDDAEAVQWFQRAADQGWPMAQLNLGETYSSGRGVSKDPVRAYMWYSVAAKSFAVGELRERAVRGREEVRAALSSQEAARAEEMAQSWKPHASAAQ